MSSTEQQGCPTEVVGDRTCSMRPGETVAEFIARAAAAHGPLSDIEIVRLRAIFQPTDTKPAVAPRSFPAAA
jgi:hypothetical protein